MVTFPVYQFCNILSQKIEKDFGGYPTFGPFKMKAPHKRKYGNVLKNLYYQLKMVKNVLNWEILMFLKKYFSDGNCAVFSMFSSLNMS